MKDTLALRGIVALIIFTTFQLFSLVMVIFTNLWTIDLIYVYWLQWKKLFSYTLFLLLILFSSHSKKVTKYEIIYQTSLIYFGHIWTTFSKTICRKGSKISNSYYYSFVFLLFIMRVTVSRNMFVIHYTKYTVRID